MHSHQTWQLFLAVVTNMVTHCEGGASYPPVTILTSQQLWLCWPLWRKSTPDLITQVELRNCRQSLPSSRLPNSGRCGVLIAKVSRLSSQYLSALRLSLMMTSFFGFQPEVCATPHHSIGSTKKLFGIGREDLESFSLAPGMY